MSEPDLDAELRALEQSLARLEPQGQLARDAVLFRAGRVSAQPGWLWPAGALASTAAAAILGWLLWRQPTPEPQVVVVKHIEIVTVPVAQEQPVCRTQNDQPPV